MTPEPNPSEVVAFVVRDRETGQVSFHEVLESGAYSEGRLTHLVTRRVAQLESQYRFPRYEVEQGIYNSLEAFYHFCPECVPSKQGHS